MQIKEILCEQCSCRGYQYANEVNEWFSSFLKTDCLLVRMTAVSNRISGGRAASSRQRRGEESVAKFNSLSCPIAFSNESQFLIVSKASAEDVASRYIILNV